MNDISLDSVLIENAQQDLQKQLKDMSNYVNQYAADKDLQDLDE